LLKTKNGEAVLRKYFRTYGQLAQRFGTGLILESATWRASSDWGTRLGYSPKEVDHANSRAIALLEELRGEFKANDKSIVISGCLGPRGDGYNPGRTMSANEAQAYHGNQVRVFEDSGADMVTAITMNYVEEALGIARAAERAAMPVALSFTVETDGNLPTGQRLGDAIEQVDAATSRYPSYYMINCAHPTHFEQVLTSGEPWTRRVRGLRANASRKSHAELNESPELDIGNPTQLGAEHARLRKRLPELNVIGGCCGTDHRHIEEIATACRPLFRTAP
jgi:S-methylmethionine-dependent homocysteine/selenocysteine methylase